MLAKLIAFLNRQLHLGINASFTKAQVVVKRPKKATNLLDYTSNYFDANKNVAVSSSLPNLRMQEID